MTSDVHSSYLEGPNAMSVIEALCEDGLPLILRCRQHETVIAGTLQESVYWEDGGGD